MHAFTIRSFICKLDAFKSKSYRLNKLKGSQDQSGWLELREPSSAITSPRTQMVYML